MEYVQINMATAHKISYFRTVIRHRKVMIRILSFRCDYHCNCPQRICADTTEKSSNVDAVAWISNGALKTHGYIMKGTNKLMQMYYNVCQQHHRHHRYKGQCIYIPKHFDLILSISFYTEKIPFRYHLHIFTISYLINFIIVCALVQ